MNYDLHQQVDNQTPDGVSASNLEVIADQGVLGPEPSKS